MTRENGTSVKRFWPISDERGLIYRVVDEQGATFWQARWDATGMRSLVGTPQPDMWIPFALPGQVVVDGSELLVSGCDNNGENCYSFTLPTIALNRMRAYDPLLGAFLQPDALDVVGRTTPEGYAYARNSPVTLYDPTGLASTNAFSDMCSEGDIQRLNDAINLAAQQIYICMNGLCGSNPNLRRTWLNSLLNNEYFCGSYYSFENWSGHYHIHGQVKDFGTKFGLDGLMENGTTGAMSLVGEDKNETWLNASVDRPIVPGDAGCLAVTRRQCVCSNTYLFT